MDYCRKCYQILKENDFPILKGKKFFTHQAKFLINLPAECMECNKKGLKTYYVIPDIYDESFHSKSFVGDAGPFFRNKYCCLDCIDNLKEDYHLTEKKLGMNVIDRFFRVDILKKSFQKGIMKIQDRGCGLSTSIILNGKYRGCIEGKYLYNDNYPYSNQYNYLLESLFNYISMTQPSSVDLVDNLYKTNFFRKEYPLLAPRDESDESDEE